MKIRNIHPSRKASLLVLMIPFLFLFIGCGRGNGDSSTDSGSENSGAIRAKLVLQHPSNQSQNVSSMQSPGGDICEDYKIDNIAVWVKDASGNIVKTYSWDCSDHQGTVTAVQAGTGYSVTYIGTTRSDNGDWQAQAHDIEVVKNHTTEMGELSLIYIGDDSVRPTIATHSPISRAAGLSINPEITLAFSEEVVPASVVTSCSLIEAGSSIPVDIDISYDDATHTATIKPINVLSAGTEYTVEVSAGVEDLASLNMAFDYSWNFTTWIGTVCTDDDTDSYYAQNGCGTAVDCIDTDANINPGATEICNGIDDNCNDLLDEDLSTTTFYRDLDGDFFGDPLNSVQACSAPNGYILDNSDCDDSDLNIYPEAVEICDGNDNDCNGLFDDRVAGGCLFIEGQLLHRGAPMHDITDVDPSFWIRNEDTGQSHTDYTTHYDPTNGTYGIYNIPENAGISITFHTTGERMTLPNNYRSSLTTWDSGLLPQLDINLHVIMHLLQPWDNCHVADWDSEFYTLYTSPVRFEWESMSGPITYTVIVYRARDGDHPDGYGYIEQVINEEVIDTSYEITLSPSAEYEHYEFELHVYENNVLIGNLMTTASWGYGWDYRFKIDN